MVVIATEHSDNRRQTECIECLHAMPRCEGGKACSRLKSPFFKGGFRGNINMDAVK